MPVDTALDLGWAAFVIVLVMLAVPVLVVLASAVNTYVSNRNLHKERMALIQRGESLETIARLDGEQRRQSGGPWSSRTSALEFSATMLGAGLALLLGVPIVRAILGSLSAWGAFLLVGGVLCVVVGLFSAVATLLLRPPEHANGSLGDDASFRSRDSSGEQ